MENENYKIYADHLNFILNAFNVLIETGEIEEDIVFDLLEKIKIAINELMLISNTTDETLSQIRKTHLQYGFDEILKEVKIVKGICGYNKEKYPSF